MNTIESIKLDLKKNDSSQSKIARALGVTPAAVHNTIKAGLEGSGIFSPRIAKAVAKAANKKSEDLFPKQHVSLSD